MAQLTAVPVEQSQHRSRTVDISERSGAWSCVPGSITKDGLSQGPYHDAEVAIQHVRLGSGQSWTPGEDSRDIWSPTADGKTLFVVFGRGDGMVGRREVMAGRLLVAAPNVRLRLDAGTAGVDLFAASMSVKVIDPGGIDVLDRARLEPFLAEGIIVTRGTEFIFAPTLDFAEVIVPPGVTTSEHALSVNERYLILNGEGTMTLDGNDTDVEEGHVVCIPSGTMQFVRNSSATTPLRFYCLCTPPFTPEAYAPGAHHGQMPDGFQLADWWRLNASSYS